MRHTCLHATEPLVILHRFYFYFIFHFTFCSTAGAMTLPLSLIASLPLFCFYTSVFSRLKRADWRFFITVFIFFKYFFVLFIPSSRLAPLRNTL